ncbi:hypothetical protein ACJIZ3_005259 [Penstemon smallii]|uniref:Phospholipid scramblase n=1 Tax=Penstemon smallii TaxID=265156 RepID=A0ABD3S4D6_9LAMI
MFYASILLALCLSIFFCSEFVSFNKRAHHPVLQLLRLRRPFIAQITDGLGNELFRVRRPFWWITSSIYAEINGKEIGVVHRRWHLWRRIYDLYLGFNLLSMMSFFISSVALFSH